MLTANPETPSKPVRPPDIEGVPGVHRTVLPGKDTYVPTCYLIDPDAPHRLRLLAVRPRRDARRRGALLPETGHDGGRRPTRPPDHGPGGRGALVRDGRGARGRHRPHGGQFRAVLGNVPRGRGTGKTSAGDVHLRRRSGVRRRTRRAGRSRDPLSVVSHGPAARQAGHRRLVRRGRLL
jgi:catechol 2,3-dioxygenase-like lactoylglutathione lyase family enzyme